MGGEGWKCMGWGVGVRGWVGGGSAMEMVLPAPQQIALAKVLTNLEHDSRLELIVLWIFYSNKHLTLKAANARLL